MKLTPNPHYVDDSWSAARAWRYGYAAGAAEERAAIVEWLLCEEREIDWSAFFQRVAMRHIAGRIESGRHHVESGSEKGGRCDPRK